MKIIAILIIICAPWSSLAAKTKIDLGTQVQSSVFIDSTSAVLLPNANPAIPAGNYTVEIAITDGTGRWSNLSTFTFTADGVHGYEVRWNPPMSWWSMGPTTTFADLGTVYGWVSFNGGPPVQIVTGSAGDFVGYFWWQPDIQLQSGYATGTFPVPIALNTLPALNLGPDGPAPQIVGAVLKSPQINWINVDPINLLGDWLTINGSGKLGVIFLDPENTTGYCGGDNGDFGTYTVAKALLGGSIYFETNGGVGQGNIAFCNGIVRIGSSGGSGNDGTIELARTHVLPQPASGLVACNSGNEGSQQAVLNATSNIWGAVVTGGGSNHVLAYCDGTNWTVVGK